MYDRLLYDKNLTSILKEKVKSTQVIQNNLVKNLSTERLKYGNAFGLKKKDAIRQETSRNNKKKLGINDNEINSKKDISNLKNDEFNDNLKFYENFLQKKLETNEISPLRAPLQSIHMEDDPIEIALAPIEPVEYV